MPKPAVTKAYVSYLEGTADDLLQDAYQNDESKHGRAFEDTLQFVINAYCSLHDQAGERSYDFVQNLPHGPEYGTEDAVIALRILRRTRDALRELVEHDAEFKASFQGDRVTSSQTDESVRNDAREFTERNEVDEATNQAIMESATEGEATEREVSDAAYNFQDSADIEHRVALSMRDRLDVPQETADAPLPSASSIPEVSPPAADVPPDDASPTYDPPTRIVLKKETYIQQSPSIVFNRAKMWLIDAIVKVVRGSEKEDQFPRISPLIAAKDLGEHGVTHFDLVETVRDVRQMVRALRPPLSESFENLNGMQMFVNLRGPDGKPIAPTEVRIAVNDALGSFTDLHGDPEEDRYNLFGKHDDE